MTIGKGNWPLPDGHPLKGTRIIFGNRPQQPSETSSENEESPNPDQQRLHELCEESMKKRGLT